MRAQGQSTEATSLLVTFTFSEYVRLLARDIEAFVTPFPPTTGAQPTSSASAPASAALAVSNFTVEDTITRTVYIAIVSGWSSLALLDSAVQVQPQTSSPTLIHPPPARACTPRAALAAAARAQPRAAAHRPM